MKKTEKPDRLQAFRALPLWTWLFPVLAAIGVFLGLVLILIPSIQGLAEDRQLVEQMKLEKEKLTAKREFLETLDRTQLQRDLELVEVVLPVEKPVYPYMQALQNLITLHDELAMTGYDLAPGKLSTESAEIADKGQYQMMETELGLQGPIEAMMNFLTDYERLAPMVSVMTATITGSFEQDVDTTTPTQVDITVGVHNAPWPESISAIDSPIHQYEGDFAATRSRMSEHTDYDTGQVTVPLLQFGRENPFNY
jgi:hypothetical protein